MRPGLFPQVEASLQISQYFNSGTFKLLGSLPFREAPEMSFSCSFIDTGALLSILLTGSMCIHAYRDHSTVYI